jgi:TorA maturation chaperone TorD
MPLAPPFESLYGNLGNSDVFKDATNVAEFYQAYGWVSKFKGKVKDDHLGIELLFLTLLVEKYLVLDDSACQTEMRKEIRRFIYSHILSWIAEWNNLVQKNAATLCFKGIGTLILACVEDIYSILGQFTAASLQYGDLKN